MKDLLEKLGVDPNLQGAELVSVLCSEKQKSISKLKDADGNPIKEMECNIRIVIIDQVLEEVLKLVKDSNNEADKPVITDNELIKEDYSFKNDISEKSPVQAEQSEISDDPFERAAEAFGNEDYATAFNLFLMVAQDGNDLAMNIIGMMYELGYGTDEDEEKSFYWHKKAAAKGNADSMAQLGVIYRNGSNTVRKNYAEALKWLGKAAKLGQPFAMLNIGLMYLNGEGLDKNDEKSFLWFNKAAEKGNTDAHVKLGDCYFEGIGTNHNMSEAIKCYTVAAEKGNAYSAYRLAIMYEIGIGITKNLSKAIEWYMIAADLGHPDANFKVGYFYLYGEGVEQDYKKSFEYFSVSAENGYSTALLALGMMYEDGLGVKQNFYKAFEYYKSAAEQDEDDSMYYLGLCYENGRGVKADFVQAVYWMQRAAEKNNSNAIKWLENEKIFCMSSYPVNAFKKDYVGDYQIAGNFDDEFNGFGELQYLTGNRKGERYKGNFSLGKFKGDGEYYIDDSNMVSGVFNDGFNGTFIHTINGNTVYEGEIVSYCYHGNGIQYNEDGSVYFEGEFRDGIGCNGEGTTEFTGKDGSRMKLVGVIRDGKLEGNGKMINISEGTCWEGSFVDGRVKGQATFHDSDGTKYIGTFQDESTGTVKVVDKNNRLIFEGGYKNSSYNGKGILYNSDGSKLHGEWDIGRLVSGKGVYLYTLDNGIVVKDIGPFVNGNLNGEGRRLVLSGEDEGGYWEGTFLNGSIHGFCTFYKKNGERQETQCSNGVFHGLMKLYSPKGALYWQTFYNKGNEVGPRKETYAYKLSKRK